MKTEFSKEEALFLAGKGIKITHKFFSDNEWFTYNDKGEVVLEDGVVTTKSEFWEHRQEGFWSHGYMLYW